MFLDSQVIVRKTKLYKFIKKCEDLIRLQLNDILALLNGNILS